MSSLVVSLDNYLIPLDEIHQATGNFSSESRIGDGGFGIVHKGQLSDNWQKRTVAIKRLNPDGNQGNNEFRNEVAMVSSFQHPNIISFIGYCDDANEKIIVYEYAVNGSLDQHLQDPHKRHSLTWTQRLKICLGAARGLEYLHSGLGEHVRVIHRDVKSANILLDDKLEAKICDFGLSKFGARNQENTQLFTKVAGTRYYMDPVYNERSRLQKESDVYSFGVVMFELLSGTLVYEAKCFGETTETQYLIDVVRSYYDQKENSEGPDRLIDPIIRSHIDARSFHAFKELAGECLNLNIRERPTTDQIIHKLEEALNIQLDGNKDLSEDTFAKERAITYWLEAIDPRHRYGKNLHLYYKAWFDSQALQPFFYWLDIGDGKQITVQKCPRNVLHFQSIKYLGHKEREQYEVIIENGRLMYKENGRLVKTIEGTKWIFVFTTSRILYINQKEKGRFHHSSFIAGGATLATGRMVIHNGVLKAISNRDLYLKTEEHFKEFIWFLIEQQVDLTNVKIQGSKTQLAEFKERQKRAHEDFIARQQRDLEEYKARQQRELEEYEARLQRDHEEYKARQERENENYKVGYQQKDHGSIKLGSNEHMISPQKSAINQKESNMVMPESPMLEPLINRDLAALKLQKAYKGFRTRRLLADSAIIAEKMWREALDLRSSVAKCHSLKLKN